MTLKIKTQFIFRSLTREWMDHEHQKIYLYEAAQLEPTEDAKGSVDNVAKGLMGDDSNHLTDMK